VSKRRARSDAMMYSLSEFAFILLFLSLAAAVLLLGRYADAAARAVSLEQEVSVLEQEVAFLNEILSEKQYGVVPCWRRPEQSVPPVVGTVTIHGRDVFSVARAADGRTVEIASREDESADAIEGTLRSLFRQDLEYAGEMNCYLRVAVHNQTNSFTFYRNVADVVSGTGMVVVNE
jgi:hypothetical protein